MAFEGEPRVIPIKGIARAGADSIVEDGAMNEVIGLEYKDGSFVPYSGTDNGHPFRKDVQRFYVHKTSTQTNVILQFADGLFWISESGFYDGEWVEDLGCLGPLYIGKAKDVEFIGNVVCVNVGDGVNNYVFKNGGYEAYYINSSDLPTINLRVTIGLPNDGNNIGIHLSSGQQTSIGVKDGFSRYDSIVPLLNKCKRLVTDSGGLTGHVLACVAYQLTTGEYVLASSPVILARPMNKQGNVFGKVLSVSPSSSSDIFKNELKYEANTCISLQGEIEKEEKYDLSCDYNDYYSYVKSSIGNSIVCYYKQDNKYCMAAQEPNSTPTIVSSISRFVKGNVTVYDIIDTYVTGNKIQYSVSGSKKDLSSLISSVCVFISSEINPYEDIERYKDDMTDGGVFNYDELIGQGIAINREYINSFYCKLKNVEDIKDEFNNVTNFYKVADIDYKELIEGTYNEWIDIDTKGKLAENLFSQDTLPVSAFDYAIVTDSRINAYNSRLHIYNYVQKLFEGYDIGQFVQYGGVGQFNNQGSIYADNLYIKVYGGKTEGNYIVVKHGTLLSNNLQVYLNPFITYPSPDATKMEIYAEQEGKWMKASFKLKKSKYGAYSYGIVNSLTDISYGDLSKILQDIDYTPVLEEEPFVIRRNGVKVSGTYSPNYFPPSNTYIVGNSSIIRVALLSTSLSQDTFGQYPLLVFCTDGIYSMGVDTSGVGVYSNIAPFSREVCVNPNSICEIDGAVLFASSKGLMIATSQGVQEFVPTMNGLNRHIPKDDNSYGVGLKWYRDIINNSSSTQLLDSVDDELDFRDYVADPDTYITYVSQKNKIVVYNGKQPYIYWIDIPTRNVTKLPTSIKMDNDNYPTELYVKADGSILEFNQLSAKGNTQTMFQTRPIKLDGGMKADYRVVVRGHFKSDEQDKVAALLVLGSYDGECWQPIGYKEKSLNGSFNDIGCDTDRVTHKYMMIIFSASLNRDSHIDGVELTKKNKYNNKLK